MNADQLDQIIKLHGHDQERREQPVGNDVEENAAYTKEENLNSMHIVFGVIVHTE
jgi:hypothetical protein